MKRRLTLVLCRARERNGIAFLSGALNTLAPNEFIWCRSVREFVVVMLTRRQEIQTILAMSDIEALIAACVTRIFKMQWPIALGVFHPKQWTVTLDYSYAPHKAQVFSRFLETMPSENIISTSRATLTSCAAIRAKFSSGCQVVSFPVPLPGKEWPCVRHPSDSVVTVGRYVDFKVCTIFAMIGVIEKLNDAGRRVDYHIYGEGPSELSLKTRITGSRWRSRLHLHGLLSQEDYRRTMFVHTVFFGMGSALFQAGVAGIPGIVAIQGESEPRCYGLITDHEHGANPVFGDPTPELPVLPLEQTLLRVLELDRDSWSRLAEESRKVATPYSGPQLLSGIREALARCKRLSGVRVTIPDLMRIRVETYYAQIRGIPGIHV